MVDLRVNDGGLSPVLAWGVPEETIGKRIRGLRLARNLTQEQLANALKIRKQTVSSWEKDQVKDMQLANLFALCDALDCEPRYLALGHTNRLAPSLRGFAVTDSTRIRLRKASSSD